MFISGRSRRLRRCSGAQIWMQPISCKYQLGDVKWLQESRGQHDHLTTGGANAVQTIRGAISGY